MTNGTKAPTTDIKNVKMGPIKARGLDIQKVQPGPPSKLSILVYAPPGGGKTWFAGTFPNVLFINCMGGMATVRNKNVSFVEPKSYDDLLQCAIIENLTGFDTIVLDTATEAARLVADYTTSQSNHEVPGLQDWMQIIERIRQYFRKLLSLPMHVIVTAEEGFNKDEDTGKMTYGPSLPGKLFGEAGALFDCVFHLISKTNPQSHTTEWFLVTKPSGMYQQVKDRFGVLAHQEVPDYKVIWDKISKS